MTVDAGVPSPQGWQSIADALFHNARRRPRHPALIDRGRTLTHGELAPLVARTAAHLAEIGVRPGQIVGVALADHAEHLVVLYAVACLGAVILPMDVRWTEEEKRRLAAFFGAQAVLVEPGAAPLPGLRSVPVDAAWHAAVAAADGGREFLRRRDQPLMLSLSSGTTGTPKGPLVTHGHFLHRLYIYTIGLTFNEADRFLCATPLYFGGGRYMSMAYLFMGATVAVRAPPYKPEELAAAVNDGGVTSLFLVPTLLRRMLDLPKAAAPLFGRLRLLVSSGAVLHAEERLAVMRELCPNFVNFYSSTEGGGISVLRADDPPEAHGSVGRIVFGTEVEIVDEAHRRLPPGEVGRIRYRGGSVAAGFHNDPVASAEAFRDGWYYPGDLGRLDERGFLFLAGRAKDMIIRGGVNIYPSEIEHALVAHPAVRDAAVVGWPSRHYGEEVAAFVVRKGDADEAELLRHCRAALAPYKVPRAVLFVDELPKSSVGKVVKKDLVDRLPPLA